MSNQAYSDFDEKLIEAFESAWLKGDPRSIKDFLPDATDPRYVGTLEELVHIDLEFRWKEFEKSEAKSKRPPTVEDYLGQYPELDEVKLGLIQGEFDLIGRFGGQVSVDDFVSRFGESISGSELRPILQSQLSEINRSRQVKPGVTLGRYEIVNEHGRGGFGAVWRATDTKLGRRIAVKQLGQRLASDSESRRRFISEARVTARLEHPGIVPVYDISNVQEDHAYYTMRLIQGRTMAEAIDDLHQKEPGSNEFRLLRQRLLQSFVDVCLTIEYAHAQGVIHRDLKPQNIIVGNYGETILLDWGLASVIDEPSGVELDEAIGADPEVLSKEESIETLRGSVLGTPAYMSPEQARGEVENVTRLSDVYSLGATLYHLITGTLPFTDRPIDGLLDRVKVGDLPAASLLNSRVEKSLSCIASKAMENDTADRYQGVAALVDDVQRFIADQPVSAYRDPFLARAARWIRKNPTMAASLVMTMLFVFVASVAGLMVSSAWEAKEEKRIADLQIAAERADATALSQIQNGRFDAAAKTLAQATKLVADEPRLREIVERIRAREERTSKIVDFYRLGTKAQEETFFDRTNRSAIYCQAALDELGVLEQPSWWNHLPDADLSEIQREQLRSEVYRITTLLASMRLAETANDAASLSILIDPTSLPDDGPAMTSFKAASFAANVANRYRKSRAMQMIEDVGGVSQGTQKSVDMKNLNPLNAVDSAVMGSILDNNVPREGIVRTAISGLLERRNPNVVAKQWLDDALKYNPDWYWLPVFMGTSQMRTGAPEEGVRTISHAVGIRPDYWVGYQYRALASAAAAVEEKSKKRRTALLNAASRDIQRAMDLDPNNSSLFWTKAILQFQSGGNPEQIADTFLTAFELHPGLTEIRGGHYTAVTRMFFDRAQGFVTLQQDEGNQSVELAVLDIAIQLWQSQLDGAEKLCQEANEKHADDPTIKRLSQWIANARDLKNGTPIEVSSDARFAWRFHLANAAYHRIVKDFASEEQSLREALKLVKADWQLGINQTQLASCLVRRGQLDEAAELVRDTIQLDRAVDLTEFEATAKEADAVELLQLCADFRKLREPKHSFPDGDRIANPALLNAGFELGLSYHWAPFSRRTTAASWNNYGQSRTTAEAVSTDAQEGDRCLRLTLDCPKEEGSYGQMSQVVPVTVGQKYELTFWAKANSLSENSVFVGVAEEGEEGMEEAVAIAANDSDWTQYRLSFVADQPHVSVMVRAQGKGEAWLDNLQIQAERQ